MLKQNFKNFGEKQERFMKQKVFNDDPCHMSEFNEKLERDKRIVLDGNETSLQHASLERSHKCIAE